VEGGEEGVTGDSTTLELSQQGVGDGDEVGLRALNAHQHG
jgi:hypothetical protein